MESNEDRLKKLEAGKEKLAAFRKRKAKKKKPDSQKINDTESNINEAENSSKNYQNRENGRGLSPPPLSDFRDVWSASDESDARSSVFFEAKLAQAKQRIAELEEAVEGKQLALDAAIKKSETTKNMQDVGSSQAESGLDNKGVGMMEVESALAQRDALLSQLSASLFESLGNTDVNKTVQAQVDALAQHVYQLQAQLQLADQSLEEQLQLHESSAQALYGAKSQMLQLQEIITSKDKQLACLIQEKEQTMQHDQLLQNSPQKNADYETIISDHESKLASFQDLLSVKEQELTSREQTWASREREWAAREHGWVSRDQERASREELLQSSIESQSAQILALVGSQDAMKAEEQELLAKCARLESQLQTSGLEETERLSNLERELEDLRQAHESDQRQIEELGKAKAEREEEVSRANQRLSGYETLQSEHDNLCAKYSECLSHLRELELAKSGLEEKLSAVNFSAADIDSVRAELDQLKLKHQQEAEKQAQTEKDFVELENKYSFDTDALNNKINELQSIVQTSEAALQTANGTAAAEKAAVAELQRTLREKDEMLDSHSQRLVELEETLEASRTSTEEVQKLLSAAEERISAMTKELEASEQNLISNNKTVASVEKLQAEKESLENILGTAQDALKQREEECCKYAEQIVALQEEILSAKHVHGVEQSELHYQANQLEEQIETVHSEYEAQRAKVAEIEKQLKEEQENRNEILVEKQELEKELTVANEEKSLMLSTLQCLNMKLKPHNEQMQDSMISSLNTHDHECQAKVETEQCGEPKKECEALISQINSLTEKLEQQKTKLKDAETVVANLTGNLKETEETLTATQNELENVHEEHASSAKEVESKLALLESKAQEAEDLKTEVAALKGVREQLVEQDRCQEELQSQLEDTVTRWQKLQRIVQEKEVELQQSQEALEEQQRICATLRRTFEEEREELQSEISSLNTALQGEKEQKAVSGCEVWDLRGKVQILEGEAADLLEGKFSESAVLSETVMNLREEMTGATERLALREAEMLEAKQSTEEKLEKLTASNVEKNVEIEDLKKKAVVKDEEMQSLNSQLSELRDESMNNKAREDNMKESLAYLESQVKDLSTDNEDKDLKIKDLNTMEKSQKDKVASLETELNDLRKVCDEISTSANLSICGAEGLQAVFTKKDTDIAELQNLLAQREAELNTEHSSSKQAIKDMRHKCEEAENALQATLKEKEDIVLELRQAKEQISEVENIHKLLQTTHLETQQKLGDAEQALQSVALEKEGFATDLEQMEQQASEAEEKHAVLQAAYAELQGKFDESEQTLQAAVLGKESIEAECKQMKQQRSEVESQCEALNIAHSEMQGNLSHFEKTLQSTLQEKKNSEEELAETKRHASELESEQNSLKTSLSEMQGKLDNTEAQLRSTTAEKCDREAELGQLKQNASDMEEKYKALTANYSQVQEKVCSAEEALQTVVKEKDSLEAEVLQLKGQIIEAESQYQCLQASSSEIQASAEEKSHANELLSQTLSDKNSSISDLVKEKESLQLKVAETSASLQSMQASLQTLENANEELKVCCVEKDSCISELEDKVAKANKKMQRTEGFSSSLSQELINKDEALIEHASQADDLNVLIAKMSEEIQEKIASIEELNETQRTLQLQNEQYASKSNTFLEENANQQEKLEAQIEENTNQRERLEAQIEENANQRERLEAQIEENANQRERLEAQIEESASQRERLEAQIEEIKSALAMKELQLSDLESQLNEEKLTHEQTLQKLEKSETESHRAESQISHLKECLQDTEASLVSQVVLTEETTNETVRLADKLEGKDADLKEANEKLVALKEEHTAVLSQLDSVQTANDSLEANISRLQVDMDNQELINTQYAVQCKQLNEKLTQMTQALEGKEATVFDLKHDIDMYQKEINDLRADVEHRDVDMASLQEELSAAKASIERKHEEAEMLKSNFDSCMGDVQVKLAEQEGEVKRLRSQLAEETRSVHQGKDQMKEMFEVQVSQMEDKIIKCEQQKERLEKELEDVRCKAASSKDLYEHQLAELELSLQTANSDVIRYKDELSKVTNNHDCSLAGLKRLHEIQTSELEDNCMALEKTVAEQKRHITEMQNKVHKERANLEQNFEIQISDAEEKRRLTELEIDRLKRHLEEMRSDHAREMQQLEKSYESRLFELEDKCCVATSELDRLRASMMDPSGEHHENLLAAESRLHEIDELRRELEMRNSALEDEVVSLKETAREREEEMMTVLKGAAERHQEDTNELDQEVSRLNERLAEQLKHVKTLEQEHEEKIQDMKSRNSQLEEKVKVLEMHVEHDKEFRKDEGEAKISNSEMIELQNRITSLSEENNSLKRQLFMQRQRERNEHLTSGVEEICPPYASTPRNGQGDDRFSPTDEVPVVEGFVAEHSKQYKSSPLSKERKDNQEPDFVEEQAEGFQPEIEHGEIVDDVHRLNIHPIQEAEVTEGFQPETSDVFVMEDPEGSIDHSQWPPNLSVGMSPSHRHSQQWQFDFNSTPQPDSQSDDHHTNQDAVHHSIDNLSHSVETANEADKDQASSVNTVEQNEAPQNSEITAADHEKKIKAMLEELEEHYVGKLRRQEVDLTHDFATKEENLKRDLEQSYAQRLQAVRYEWERKFTKALQKARKEMETRHLNELRQLRHGTSSPLARHPDQLTGRTSPQDAQAPGTTDVGMPAKEESQEDLGETMEQLHKENRELAEVRDVLLRQIEISQARGLHSKVQHELQSLLINRDTSASASPPSAPSSSTSATPTRTAASPVGGDPVKGQDTEVDQVDGNEDGDESLSARSEVSETSSARERFLEELEDMSHQSSADLPLEWELTTTLLPSAMIGGGDGGESGGNSGSSGGTNPPEHRSIWEVFDGRCVRQDCQEVRLKLHRVTQWLLDKQAQQGEEAAVPVSELTNLFLEEGFLLGEDDEGFFCLADGSDVDFKFEEDESFELDTAQGVSNDVVKGKGPADKEEMCDKSFHDSENVDENLKPPDLKANENPIPLVENELKVLAKHSEQSGEKLSAELESLKIEKSELEEKCKALQKQHIFVGLEKKRLEEELYNLKQRSPTHSHIPLTDARGDKEINSFPKTNEVGVSSDSGLEVTRSESHDAQHLKDSSTQTEVCEKPAAQPPSPSNDRIVHHLQLMLVEKESAITVLQQEITKLKYELNPQTISENSQDNYSRDKVGMLEAQIQTMEASLAAKDRMINALQCDLNRLIYPENQNLSNRSEEKKHSPKAQEQLDKCDRKQDTDEGNEAVNTSNCLLSETESSSHYATANESSGDLDCSMALSIDVFEVGGARVSNISSNSSSRLNVDSLNDEASSDQSEQGTPLGLQDSELAEELGKLRRDMKETKALYSRENTLLQEALHRDSRAKDMVMNKTEGDLSFRKSLSDNYIFSLRDAAPSHDEASMRGKTSSEVEIVKQRLVICLEQNRMLERENTTLRARLREQEAIVLQLKVKLEQKEQDSQHWRDSFGSQISALQSQRNDLIQLIRDLDAGHKKSISESLPAGVLARDEAAATAASVHEDLMERLEELDHLHRMLTQRQVELQHCESQRQHLEQLCLLKDLTEMQLSRQKRLMEEQLSELELRLRDRETTLVEEKSKLLAELKNKDASLAGVDRASYTSSEKDSQEFSLLHGLGDDDQLPRSASMGDLPYSPRESTPQRRYSGATKASHTPPVSAEEADQQHLEAIERLRSKLKLEYEIRTARIAESQAAAIANYWERQHNKQT